MGWFSGGTDKSWGGRATREQRGRAVRAQERWEKEKKDIREARRRERDHDKGARSMRKTLTALGAAGVLALAGGTVAPALASANAPAPAAHMPPPVPQPGGTGSPEYPAPSVANTLNCQGSTFYWADKFGEVDHWFSGGPWFTDPDFTGYQNVCYVWKELSAPYEFQLMLVGGPGNGDCVTELPQYSHDVRATGCAYHQPNEQWYVNTDNTWGNASIGAVYCLAGIDPPGTAWIGAAVCDPVGPSNEISIYAT